MTRRLFSCHGVVRSGVPDGLVFWFCHGDMRSVYRRFKDGYMVLMSAENTHITLASVLHFHVVLALFIKFWVLDLLLCVYFEMQA